MRFESNRTAIMYFPEAEEYVFGPNVYAGYLDDDHMVLWGFRHMILGYKPHHADYGPVGFTGWRHTSKWAERMCSAVQESFDTVIDAAPTESHVRGEPNLEYLEGISESTADYHKTHRKRVKGY